MQLINSSNNFENAVNQKIKCIDIVILFMPNVKIIFCKQDKTK